MNSAAVYGFVRNLQGDIIALADKDGEIVVEYSYDPWGKVQCAFPQAEEGAEQDEMAMLATAVFCPLTYRGYNYDFTTGLYYLQSRYYNPEWGRFLNVDDTSILLETQGETHNANLFAYCNNNPVNNVDYTGYTPLNATIAFVYGLYIFYYLAYELDCRNESWLLNYKYEIFPNIDFQHGIINASFNFNVKNGVFSSKSYQVSVSVGLRKDWISYRNDFKMTLNSKTLKIGSILVGMLGNISGPTGIVASAYGYVLAETLETVEDNLEELSKVLFMSGYSDADVLGVISPVWETKSKYTWTDQGYVESNTSVDRTTTYIFSSDTVRHTF